MPADPTIEERADAILSALSDRRQLPPFTAGDAAFDVAQAYRVNAAVRRRRMARGERPVGRKVGFTNRTIWDEYGVHAPIWGHVYDSTVRFAADGPDLPVGHLVEPRIEPELMLHLAAAPRPDMDDDALMACIGAVSHGFEIVQSLFAGWRFRAADTVAAFALHGALHVGPPVPVAPADRDRWRERLADFDIVLLRDGVEMDRGHSANVLGGGPLAALRHLVEVVAGDPEALPIEAGEIVSTGTLTRALPVEPGERWGTRLGRIDIPGATVRLVP
ncbi:2-keto-4-pentenoate hydratase [Alsobacter sp. R-9]